MDSKNKYLQDIIKGLKLVANLQKKSKDKKLIDKKLNELNKLIRKDYIKINNQISSKELMKSQQNLLTLYNKLKETVIYPALTNKKVVAVGGRENTGKSEMLNSLLEIDNLATDIKTTTIANYICYNNEEKITAYNLFGSQIEIEQEALQAIKYNFVDKYGITLSQFLTEIIIQRKKFKYRNLVFIDTPSYKKENLAENIATINSASYHFQKSDYLLWVLNIEDANLLIKDIEFINNLNFSGAVFVVFNKTEKKSTVEIKKVLNKAEKNLVALKNELIDVSVYSANKLIEFLAKINRENNELKLINQFKELFNQLKRQYFKKLNNADKKLQQLKKISKDNKLSKEEFIKELLINVKDEIELRKETLKEIENFKQEVIELVKDILTELEISFFDYQKRGDKLLEAIKNDEFELAKRLIDLGVNLEVSDEQGNTPLVWAIKKNDKKLIKQLLIAGSEFSYLDGEKIEDPVPGEGTEKNPYIISALSGLEKIGSEDYSLVAHYKLSRDIDASLTQEKEYNNGQGWQAIGKSKELNDFQAFTGVLNGAGYKIKGLYFNRPQDSQVGLFRVVGPGGVIKNLDITSAKFFAKEEVGGIAGRVRLGEIENCSFNGIIKGDKNIGQIVGKNEGGEIKSVSSQGEIVGSINVGGLIGYNIYYGLLNNSFSSSKVKGKKKIGGVIGGNDQGGQIENSYAKGDIVGGAIIGGLSGYNYGSIKKSFASGDVTGTYQLGGLIGRSESKLGFGRSEIIDCHALGNISGKRLLGGLVGINKDLIKKTYASGKLNGDEFLGGLVGYNSGKIEDSYVSRKTIVKEESKKLVGKNVNGEVINSYWKR